MVIVLASHQCGPALRSNPGPGVIKWVEFVVDSRPCSEGFSPGSPVFLPPQKSTFLNSNHGFVGRMTVMCYPRKIKLIIIIIIIIPLCSKCLKGSKKVFFLS